MEAIAPHATLIGLIFMFVLGPAVGNYVCSVVYRLPLGKTPFERHPYCGHCNADLKPIDLFPILSWLSTGGKCRYCKGTIPAIYTVIEIACLLLFAANFLFFGIGEEFLLLTGYGTFVITLAAIAWQQGWLSSSICGYALTCGALLSTLIEGTIFGWVGDFILTLVGGLVIARLLSAVRKTPFVPFATGWIWWPPLVAVVVPFEYPALAGLVLLAALLGNIHPRLATLALAGLATTLPLFTV